jgi:hypothetical protein
LLKLQKQYRSAENLSRSTMDVEGDATETPKVGKFDQSTDTIANLLGAKTGPDLVLAAAAHLHFVKKNKRSLLGK